MSTLYSKMFKEYLFEKSVCLTKLSIVSSEKIDAAYDNKLIATNGKLEVTGTITDDEFAVSTNSAVLFRKVEMYQWKEDCDDNNCNYEKVWDDDIIDSSNFEKSGHENPGYMPYESQTITSSNAKLGAFDLPQKLLEQLSTKNRINNLSEENATSHSMKVINGYYTNTNEGVANIGDIRISFYDNNADTVSVLATQTGTTFKTYTEHYTVTQLKEFYIDTNSYVNDLSLIQNPTLVRNEIEENKAKLKNMLSGEQQNLSVVDAIKMVKGA